jgi:hypothetical protein
MTTRVVKIAKNTCEFSVKLPMDMCTSGNNFDKLSLSNIKYSMQQACENRVRIRYCIVKLSNVVIAEKQENIPIEMAGC